MSELNKYCLALFFSTLMTFTSFAGEWIQGERHDTPIGVLYDWHFQGDDGQFVTNMWILDCSSNIIYYIDDTGLMLADKVKVIGDKEYFFDGSGKAYLDGQALTELPSDATNVILSNGNVSSQNRNTSQAERTPIEIFDYGTSVNSAGGTSVYMYWNNNSGKVIKYLTVDMVPCNAVGDIQTCDIRGYSVFSGQIIGPIRDEEKKYLSRYHGAYSHMFNSTKYTQEELRRTFAQTTFWDCIWYNHTIRQVRLLNITIQYMDGSIEQINPANVINLPEEGVAAHWKQDHLDG